MTEFNLYLYPGKELKEVLDRHIGAGKKYPLGESLTFVDDKEKSGFTIKEDVTFKAGTKMQSLYCKFLLQILNLDTQNLLVSKKIDQHQKNNPMKMMMWILILVKKHTAVILSW